MGINRYDSISGPRQGDHVFNDLASAANEAAAQIAAAAERLRVANHPQLASAMSRVSETGRRFNDVRNDTRFRAALPVRRQSTDISKLLESKGLGGDRNSQTFSALRSAVIHGVREMILGDPSSIGKGYSRLMTVRNGVTEAAFDSVAAERIKASLASSERQDFERFVAVGKEILLALVDSVVDAVATLNRARIDSSA